ncbi:MAG: hypothetical protein H8E27_01835 [Verrucomicrobia subdivision 3 bacterium]|nr:hypothetical protein [Limisphaerales bacterium]
MKRLRTFTLLAASGLLVGCAALERTDNGAYMGPFHAPSNSHLVPGGLPADLLRVAVMPLMPGRGNVPAERGTPLLQTILTEELSRARLFEVVTVTSHRLHGLFNERAIYADAALPFDFLPMLAKETGCQAVLFCELTTYRAYPPIGVGWKLHLFSLEDGQLIWATDEVFDAGQTTVNNSLRRHIREHQSSSVLAATELLILNSPRELGRYSLGSIFQHLSEKNAKEMLLAADNEDSQSVSGNPEPVTPPTEEPEPPGPTVPEGSEEPAPEPPIPGAT